MDYEFYRYDAHIRSDFIRDLPKYTDCQVVMYGLNAHKAYPENTPIEFSERITYFELLTSLRPDVVIIAQKSRMFKDYHPNSDKNVSWLPYGFKDSMIPKIVIEEDYHYEINDNWYVENNVNLILQRHYSQSLRQNKVAMMWFPFSIDIDRFKFFDGHGRINKICFVGSLTANDVYKYRKQAVNELGNKGMLDSFPNRSRVGKQYLTNNFFGLEFLLPKDCYCAYENDFSNLIQLAEKILSDKEFVEQTRFKALQHVMNHHTNEIRANQLDEIIRSVL
jgi:hypothetical protein